MDSSCFWMEENVICENSWMGQVDEEAGEEMEFSISTVCADLSDVEPEPCSLQSQQSKPKTGDSFSCKDSRALLDCLAPEKHGSCRCLSPVVCLERFQDIGIYSPTSPSKSSVSGVQMTNKSKVAPKTNRKQRKKNNTISKKSKNAAAGDCRECEGCLHPLVFVEKVKTEQPLAEQQIPLTMDFFPCLKMWLVKQESEFLMELQKKWRLPELSIKGLSSIEHLSGQPEKQLMLAMQSQWAHFSKYVDIRKEEDMAPRKAKAMAKTRIYQQSNNKFFKEIGVGMEFSDSSDSDSEEELGRMRVFKRRFVSTERMTQPCTAPVKLPESLWQFINKERQNAIQMTLDRQTFLRRHNGAKNYGLVEQDLCYDYLFKEDIVENQCGKSLVMWSMSGSYPWPILTLNSTIVGESLGKHQSFVYFLGSYQYGKVSTVKLLPFLPNLVQNYREKLDNRHYQSAVVEAIEILRNQWGLPHMTHGVIGWALKVMASSSSFQFDVHPAVPVPAFVQESIIIHKKRERAKLQTKHFVQRVLGKASSGMEFTLSCMKEATSVNKDLREVNVRRVLMKEKQIKDFCIRCGKPEENLSDHPFFMAYYCQICLKLAQERILQCSKSKSFLYCVICLKAASRKGNRCQDKSCLRWYCAECICLLRIQENQIEDSCLVCNSDLGKSEDLVHVRSDEAMIYALYHRGEKNIPNCMRPPVLRVMSLFEESLICWSILKSLGIEVQLYCTVECAPDTEIEKGISYIDNIFSLTWEKMRSLAPIDLVVVGPGWPETRVKQDLSEIAKQDAAGQTPHTLIYVRRILHILRQTQEEEPLYVLSLADRTPKEVQEAVSLALNNHPVVLPIKNKTNFLVWSNIVTLFRKVCPKPNLEDIYLDLFRIFAQDS